MTRPRPAGSPLSWKRRARTTRAPPCGWVVGRRSTVTVDPTGRAALTSEGTLVGVTTGGRPSGAEGVTGEDYLTAGTFSPDGRRLAVAGVRGRVALWDARTWRRLAVLRGGGSNRHEPALDFSAHGALVAASDPDAPVLALGLTRDGGELHIVTPHLTHRTIPLAPDSAARAVCARVSTGRTETEWRRWFPSADHRRTCGP